MERQTSTTLNLLAFLKLTSLGLRYAVEDQCHLYRYFNRLSKRTWQRWQSNQTFHIVPLSVSKSTKLPCSSVLSYREHIKSKTGLPQMLPLFTSFKASIKKLQLTSLRIFTLRNHSDFSIVTLWKNIASVKLTCKMFLLCLSFSYAIVVLEITKYINLLCRSMGTLTYT